MNTYHRFVFDQQERRFVGDFEQMYQAEAKEQFDSWHQDDNHRLDLNITTALVQSIDPRSILDIGSGKGLLLSMISNRERQIFGSDVSTTALEVAQARNPGASFFHIPDSSLGSLTNVLHLCNQHLGGIDLVLCSQILSYIEEWQSFIDAVFAHAQSLCVSLYIPENPIGYVKSWDELCASVEKHSKIEASLWDSVGNTGYMIATR